MQTFATATMPDEGGHFGPYGGRYVPETLMHPLQELEEEYFRCAEGPGISTRAAVLPARNFAAGRRRFILPNG